MQAGKGKDKGGKSIPWEEGAMEGNEKGKGKSSSKDKGGKRVLELGKCKEKGGKSSLWEEGAMEGKEKGKGKSSSKYFGGKDKDKCGKSGLLEEDKGNYKGGKSNLCEEGKGKEKKGKQSGKEEDKGNDKGNDKGKYLFRPLANNGKDKGKGCKGGKPTDTEEFPSPTVKKFLGWSSIYDFPEHKQRRAAGLVNRLFALQESAEESEAGSGSSSSSKQARQKGRAEGWKR